MSRDNQSPITGIDLATFEHLLHAESGNFEPLARHIESGGYICKRTRKFLAKLLRGDLKFRKGNRRTWAQIEHEIDVVCQIRFLQKIYGNFDNGYFEQLSEYQAIKLYLEQNPEMNEETVKTYLKKAKKRYKTNRVSK